MDLQFQAYAVVLGIAALLNIRQLNMLALTAVSALYLIVLPILLEFIYPIELPSTPIWYLFLVVVEITYMICAVALQCGLASWAIVALSGWNIVAHLMGAYAYINDGPFYYLYPIVLTIGECCQILACLIMSRPCMRVLYVASQKLHVGKNWNGWNQLVGDLR